MGPRETAIVFAICAFFFWSVTGQQLITTLAFVWLGGFAALLAYASGKGVGRRAADDEATERRSRAAKRSRKDRNE